MAQICRTCLEEISDSDFLSLDDASSNIRDELKVCVPELDLGLIPGARMCIYCANALHAAYDFKQKCLQTEEKIRYHKQGTESLDLVQIKQEPLDEKFDVVHGIGIGMEVVFIRDDDTTSENENDIKIHQLAQTAEDEPVKSFLKASSSTDSNTTTFSGALKAQNSVKSNGKMHFPSKKALKNVKKKSKILYSSTYESNKHKKQVLNDVKTSEVDKCYRCELCPYTTLREMLFKLHMKTHAIDKPYHCAKCDYQTSYKICLFNHSKTCGSSDSSVPKQSSKETKLFRFSQKETLQQMPVHSAEKTYKCDKCSYEVANLSTFKRHLSSHMVEKPHKCTQCDFECYDAPTLKKHMRTHKENKTLKCSTCSYSTSHHSALANHVLRHTGEKPFACTQCDYKAIQKGNLKNHMKHHTSKGPYKCTKCSYSAQVNGILQSHMKKFHS